MSPSVWFYFVQASPVVKLVMFILVTLSVLSWTVIVQRWLTIKEENRFLKEFEDEFWSGEDLMTLYNKHNSVQSLQRNINVVFVAGVKEFLKLRKMNQPSEQVMSAVERAMQVERVQVEDNLEHHLGFLASIGSISPYIGLFGTVWGIMTSFQALGQVKQATINMVAPGISEALVATALGLFAAIPAVLAYNHFSRKVERLNERYVNFEAQLLNILNRQTSIR